MALGRGLGLGALLLLVGCGPDGEADLGVQAHEVGEEIDSFIHVGGICTAGWTMAANDWGVPDTHVGAWEGIDSVDAWVDQTSSMEQASADLSAVLDERCTGARWCFIGATSNGAAVVSKTLAQNDDERWNIVWVLNTASNEGGSEISEDLGPIAEYLEIDLTCALANHIGPTEHRSGWNHDDTAGNVIYQMGGSREWRATGYWPLDFFDGSMNDGMVAAHSSAGLNDTYYVDDDDPWLCFDQHWQNHEIAFRCEGYGLDHFEMIMQLVAELGG